jgi:hypothetical protein
VGVRVFDEVLMHFHTLRLLPNLHERPDIHALLVERHHVVRTIHVNEDFFIAELVVFVAHNVVDKGLLRPTKVTTQYHELAFVFQVSLLFA